jgi:hypothetical protein
VGSWQTAPMGMVGIKRPETVLLRTAQSCAVGQCRSPGKVRHMAAAATGRRRKKSAEGFILVGVDNAEGRGTLCWP